MNLAITYATASTTTAETFRVPDGAILDVETLVEADWPIVKVSVRDGLLLCCSPPHGWLVIERAQPRQMLEAALLDFAVLADARRAVPSLYFEQPETLAPEQIKRLSLADAVRIEDHSDSSVQHALSDLYMKGRPQDIWELTGRVTPQSEPIITDDDGDYD